MLVCQKCGAQNPMGRVFCGTCGAKLDLQYIADGSVDRIPLRERWFIRYLPALVLPIVVLILIPIALGYWPKTDPIGSLPSSNVGVQRVAKQLEAMRRLAPETRTTTQFSEADINAYLKYGKSDVLGYRSISVDISRERMDVRLVKMTPVLFGVMDVPVSYDLTFLAAGGAVRPVKIRKGHVTLWGPAKYKPVTEIYGMLAREPEWAAFDHLKTLQMERERIVCDVRRE